MIPNHLSNPKLHESFRLFLKKYLRTDISREDMFVFESLIETIIEISRNEFTCDKCKQPLQLYGICIKK